MRRIAAALGVSLLVHALLLLLIWRTAAPPAPTREPPPPAPLVFEIIESQALPARPPPALPPAVPAHRRTRSRPPPVAPAPPPQVAAPTPQPLPGDAPRAPPALDLTPRLSWTPPAGSTPPSRGHTLRPGDPSLSPEVQREEERARVQARLEGFTDEDISAARARGGLPHPYLVEVRNALQRGLKESVPASPEALGYGKGMQPLLEQLARNYHASAEQYGRTGSPGLAAPSGPTQGEKIARLLPSKESFWLRLFTQALETRGMMFDRAPLLALTLELTQGRDGALLSSAVIESSGNRLFDSLVLHVAPAALGAAGPPPAEAFRRDSLRSLWRVEGRLELTPSERASLLSALPQLEGLPTQELLRIHEGAAPRLSYGARLLRYY